MKKVYTILLILFSPLTVSAHYDGGDFYGHHMNMGGFGFFGGGIFMLLFWILVIIGIIYLVKFMADSNKSKEKESGGTVEILKQRYAKGDISKEEFEKMKKDLLQ